MLICHPQRPVKSDMYHCKIAATATEFADIAQLNYATFVEEIPQHQRNPQRELVDKFHEQNTYIVCYQDTQLLGMLAFRDVRPFSLDGKIGAIEDHLDADTCRKLCEIRLLAVKPEHRRSFVFLKLTQALYAYVLDGDYSACVISGTTRQQKLYHKIGFSAFAPAVGEAEAQFVPMVLTAAQAQAFHAPFQSQQHTFYPGPVAQTTALSHTDVSHRSQPFQQLQQQVLTHLKQLTQARHVALLSGSGTLANEVMLQQLKAMHGDAEGLVCSNGEFGERLIAQAQALGLRFQTHRQTWGEPFDTGRLHTDCTHKKWLLAVHGETATGCLNDVAVLLQLKRQYGLTLALDCVSSFAAVPFSLADVDMASAASGKALGALAGLGLVFYHHQPAVTDSHGTYAQLAHYHQRTPFTLPAYLLANVLQALQAYPQRYQLLQQRMDTVLQHPLLQAFCLHSQHYPTAITYQLPEGCVDNARLNGLLLHSQSPYLHTRNWAQISTIQPHFEQDFAIFSSWLTHLLAIENGAMSV